MVIIQQSSELMVLGKPSQPSFHSIREHRALHIVPVGITLPQRGNFVAKLNKTKAPTTREYDDVQVFRMLKMRTDGQSFQEIAEELSLPTGDVSRGVNQALRYLRKQTQMKTEELRDIELARLDRIVFAHLPHVAHPRHADIVLKTMERRAKFCALDQQPDNGGDDAAETLRAFLAGARAATGVVAEAGS